MASEKDFLFPADILEIVDPRRDERARVEALQSFLDEGGAVADSELEQLENNSVINEEIARLDEGCSHVEELVLVSGDVQVSYYNEFEETDAEEIRRLIDTPLLSKGFTVQPVADTSGGRLMVGHLFEVPGARRTSAVNGLVEQVATYHAFAPYDTIAITAQNTDEQRRQYLENMIPETMSEIDELLHDAPTPLAAVMRLRRLSVDPNDIPADIVRELITYVTDFIEVKTVPLSTFELAGTRSIDINSDLSIITPYDKDHYTGGNVAVMGKIDYLYLSPYNAYVDGEMHETGDYRWAAGISAEAASGPHAYLAGQTLDVMIADIRDAAPVAPPSPRGEY